jgi:hypothetical protein
MSFCTSHAFIYWEFIRNDNTVKTLHLVQNDSIALVYPHRSVVPGSSGLSACSCFPAV